MKDRLSRGAETLLRVAELARQAALWYDRKESAAEVARMLEKIPKLLGELKVMKANLTDHLPAND